MCIRSTDAIFDRSESNQKKSRILLVDIINQLEDLSGGKTVTIYLLLQLPLSDKIIKYQCAAQIIGGVYL